MKSLIWLPFILLLAPVLHAKNDGDHPLTYTTPYSISADLVPRYPGVGEDETLKLNFIQWIWLNDNSRLGLTDQGEVYGTVSVQKLTETGQTLRKDFAYLLSGRRKVREISLDTRGRLWARDFEGSALLFDDEKWLENPARGILKRMSRSIADELIGFTVLYLATKNLVGWDLETMPTLIIGGMVATGLGIFEGLTAANRFGDLNRYPDGFRKARSDESTSSAAEKSQKLYDRTCEIELLPWPVDHSQWKP